MIVVIIFQNFSATYNCSSYGAGSYTNGQPYCYYWVKPSGSSTSVKLLQSGNLLENTGRIFIYRSCNQYISDRCAIILLINKPLKAH